MSTGGKKRETKENGQVAVPAASTDEGDCRPGFTEGCRKKERVRRSVEREKERGKRT
jgi:hypothetical protein